MLALTGSGAAGFGFGMGAAGCVGFGSDSLLVFVVRLCRCTIAKAIATPKAIQASSYKVAEAQRGVGPS
jgi:hypothetical protein